MTAPSDWLSPEAVYERQLKQEKRRGRLGPFRPKADYEIAELRHDAVVKLMTGGISACQ